MVAKEEECERDGLGFWGLADASHFIYIFVYIYIYRKRERELIKINKILLYTAQGTIITIL